MAEVIIEPMKRYWVMQAYGNEAILQECKFALLTFLKHHSEGIKRLEIWLYTDRPEYFKDYVNALPLHFRVVSAEQIKAWRGSIDFVHRVKIEVLRDMVKDRNGAVLYMDTDICLLGNIAHVFSGIEEGKRYMHVQESKLEEEANPIMAKLYRFLKKNAPLKWAGKSSNIDPHTAMWNAGVLGFHTMDAPILAEVLEFTDGVHQQFPKHVMEQFAFSLFFQWAGPVYATSREVLHYWNFKEMRGYLASFFQYFDNRTVQELAQLTGLIQIHVPLQDKASFYLNRSAIGKLRRVQWVPIPPNWEALLKQME